jgi:hypothetical protein
LRRFRRGELTGLATTVGEGEGGGRHVGELRPHMRARPPEQGRGRWGPCSSPRARPAAVLTRHGSGGGASRGRWRYAGWRRDRKPTAGD